jgi:hypothetical protein
MTLDCGTCVHTAEGHRADGQCDVRYVDGARCYCPGYRPRMRLPAPDPSPAEQAVIDRFGIFAREERLTRLAADLNREIGRIQARATEAGR